MSNHKQILTKIARSPENIACVDCGFSPPTWASINLGIFMCMNCSGVHRSMGTHISQVRSIELDKWTNDMIEGMRRTTNVQFNRSYEGKLQNASQSTSSMAYANPSMKKITAFAPDQERTQFIKNKYVSRIFYQEPSAASLAASEEVILGPDGRPLTPRSLRRHQRRLQRDQEAASAPLVIPAYDAPTSSMPSASSTSYASASSSSAASRPTATAPKPAATLNLFPDLLPAPKPATATVDPNAPPLPKVPPPRLHSPKMGNGNHKPNPSPNAASGTPAGSAASKNMFFFNKSQVTAPSASSASPSASIAPRFAPRPTPLSAASALSPTSASAAAPTPTSVASASASTPASAARFAPKPTPLFDRAGLTVSKSARTGPATLHPHSHSHAQGARPATGAGAGAGKGGLFANLQLKKASSSHSSFNVANPATGGEVDVFAALDNLNITDSTQETSGSIPNSASASEAALAHALAMAGGGGSNNGMGMGMGMSMVASASVGASGAGHDEEESAFDFLHDGDAQEEEEDPFAHLIGADDDAEEAKDLGNESLAAQPQTTNASIGNDVDVFADLTVEADVAPDRSSCASFAMNASTMAVQAEPADSSAFDFMSNAAADSDVSGSLEKPAPTPILSNSAVAAVTGDEDQLWSGGLFADDDDNVAALAVVEDDDDY